MAPRTPRSRARSAPAADQGRTRSPRTRASARRATSTADPPTVARRRPIAGAAASWPPSSLTWAPYVTDVLDGRDRCTVERWLGALPDQVRAGIEAVSIKSYDGCRQAIRAPLPQARIVCDRFRLVRGASSALDVARRERQRRARARRPKGVCRSGQHAAWRPELYQARHRLLKTRERLSERERRRLSEPRPFTTRLLSRPRAEGHAYALRLHQQSQGRLHLPPAADRVRQRPSRPPAPCPGSKPPRPSRLATEKVRRLPSPRPSW